MSPIQLIVNSGKFGSVSLPDGCTAGRFKELAGSGELFGDKILYSKKLVIRGDAGEPVDEKEPLPDKISVEGPGSIVHMLELALKKKYGAPGEARPSPAAEKPAFKPAARPPPSPQSRPPPSVPAPAPAPAAQSGGKDKELLSLQERLLRTPPRTRREPPIKSSGEGDGFTFVCDGLQGHRPYMEDRTLAVPTLPGHPGMAVFAVFDGHGGDAVSRHASKAFPDFLTSSLDRKVAPQEALVDALALLEEDIKAALGTPNVGSTAVVVLMVQEPGGSRRLLCANIGDSRAVLCRGGRARDLSVDHKPGDPKERARVEKAGGSVMMCDCLRIDGVLNLSRALGDFEFKDRKDLPARCQRVSPEPDLQEVAVTPEDEFFVLASDGVYDVHSSQRLVSCLKDAKQAQKTWGGAVSVALQRSLPGGDNVSICFVELLHGA